VLATRFGQVHEEGLVVVARRAAVVVACCWPWDIELLLWHGGTGDPCRDGKGWQGSVLRLLSAAAPPACAAAGGGGWRRAHHDGLNAKKIKNKV
jgi:hypothetical protein